jgi:hypothetical protein
MLRRWCIRSDMRRLIFVAIPVAIALVAGSGAARDAIDWPALHRPLHLPRASGGHCPVSRRATEITAARFGVAGALGSGPVYPMLPSASLDVRYRPHEWGRGPWAGEKVFWLVHPRYRGPVLIRGRRLDGKAWIRFDGGPEPRPELRIWPGESTTWSGQAPGSRGRPSYVRARVPGCYGVQTDGVTFSRVVVFVISGPR